MTDEHIRHMVNNSGATWWFHLGNTYDDVYVNGIEADGLSYRSIPPHTTWEIEYPSVCNGYWYLKDKNNVDPKGFKLYISGYGGPNAVPNIEHGGNSGSVTFNNPASADILIDDDIWKSLPRLL